MSACLLAGWHRLLYLNALYCPGALQLVETAWGKWLIEEGGVVDDITVVAVKLNVR
jgi:hypothetical protein